jgi:ribosomal protein S18 acetylase RimI-like enzyme
MLIYQNAGSSPNPEDLVRYALPWVIEAGNPYYSSLFGTADLTAILGSWMRRPSSEISILRTQFLLCEREPAGGLIALSGDELRKARKADSIALLKIVPADERKSLAARIANLSDLFMPVADNEYYLSKLGLQLPFRGKNLGRLLIDHYLEQGTLRGFRQFRLDVQMNNGVAIRRYESAGFAICHQAESKDGTLKYFSMKYGKER